MTGLFIYAIKKIMKLGTPPQLFSVSKASERVKWDMISDHEISKIINEPDSHFKA